MLWADNINAPLRVGQLKTCSFQHGSPLSIGVSSVYVSPVSTKSGQAGLDLLPAASLSSGFVHFVFLICRQLSILKRNVCVCARARAVSMLCVLMNVTQHPSE